MVLLDRAISSYMLSIVVMSLFAAAGLLFASLKRSFFTVSPASIFVEQFLTYLSIKFNPM